MAEYNFKKLTAQDIKTLFEESGETLGGAGATILNAKLIENYSNESDDDEEEMSIGFVNEDQEDISYEEAFAIILQAIEEKQQILIKLSANEGDDGYAAYYVSLVYYQNDEDTEEMNFIAMSGDFSINIRFVFRKEENDYYTRLRTSNYVEDDDLDYIEEKIPPYRNESAPACCVSGIYDSQPYWDELKIIEMFFDDKGYWFSETSGRNPSMIYDELYNFIQNTHYFPPRVKATISLPEGQTNILYFNYQGFINGSEHWFTANASGLYNLIITSDTINLSLED